MLVEKQAQYLTFSDPVKGDVRYDLKEKVLQKYKGREWTMVKNQYAFFKDVSMDNLEFKDKKFIELIRIVKLIHPKSQNISTFITSLPDALVYEGFIQEGIVFEDPAVDYYSNRMNILTKGFDQYDKNTMKFFQKTKIPLTKSFEKYYFADGIIEMNKTIASERISKVNKLLYWLGEAKITYSQLSMCFFRMWGYRNFMFRRLIEEYDFNPKSLAEYICNYLDPFENIQFDDAVQLLSDYMNMCEKIGRKAKKYPKYLKSVHDIIAANYATYRRYYDQQEFKRVIRAELEHEGQKYCVLVPKETNDIVKEGTSLNHCVSSYVERVMRKETFIAFMRLKKEPEESLVTIEITDDKLVQAKGAYNRALSEEEKEYLATYCRSRKLKNEVFKAEDEANAYRIVEEANGHQLILN